ncbi:MAG: riboflavin synthase [Candidatus Sumerlaeia bacterium]|nr:riboflavin synthase [Candidatus Sumerlaeia bacterium]
MFTGLIQHTASIVRIERAGDNCRLEIARPAGWAALAAGDSVAVDGACLTVERFSDRTLTLFASAETLRRTTLGGRIAGQRVNLERALSLGDRLGGHLVTGHVDDVGRFVAATKRGEDFWCEFEVASARWLPYLVEKGSIAVDGISLTVAALNGARFAVSVIPFTWQHTTLHERRSGDPVNLEFDLIGKYILRWLELRAEGPSAGTAAPSPNQVTLELLQKAGFV